MEATSALEQARANAARKRLEAVAASSGTKSAGPAMRAAAPAPAPGTFAARMASRGIGSRTTSGSGIGSRFMRPKTDSVQEFPTLGGGSEESSRKRMLALSKRRAAAWGGASPAGVDEAMAAELSVPEWQEAPGDEGVGVMVERLPDAGSEEVLSELDALRAVRPIVRVCAAMRRFPHPPCTVFYRWCAARGSLLAVCALSFMPVLD